jgi:hypothetical protein
MVVLLSTTIISCAQAIILINNISKVVGLSDRQKVEIISQLRESIPSCPIKIQKDKNEFPSKKSSN